jgi:Amt family ammonium transporter
MRATVAAKGCTKLACGQANKLACEIEERHSMKTLPMTWFAPILGALMFFVLVGMERTGWAADEATAPPETVVEEVAEPAAEEAEADPATLIATLATDADTLWTCLAAFLVFFMQAGFALVESGFTRAKNACNIIMKNVMDFSIGSLSFWLVGFGLMFGATNGFFGTTNFLYDASAGGGDPSAISFNWAFLIFQTVFCATAATIVSGAMAERTKFSSYLFYTVGITVIVYPIFGSWAWGGLFDGGGWLEGRGFLDFAGSTVVHSIGGWAALAGAIVLGPRIGKYSKKGMTPIPGHNIPLAALGVFILWLGWFGFNPGSTTAVGGGSFAFIAVTTNLSAAAGAIGAMICAWIFFKKPDPSFTLNGALAGLVAITAGCDCISPAFAALTGFLAGFIVVFSCVFFDRLRIDDPVGAISVHGVCGAWGTLAIGLFATDYGIFTGNGVGQLITQAVGVGAGFVWSFGVSMAIFLTVKYTIGLRVTAEEEIEGLDIGEHGIYAYPPELVGAGSNPAGQPVAGKTMPSPVAEVS